MSIVAVHGPYTFGASGAGGAGTGEVISAPAGGGVIKADANMAVGNEFTFFYEGTTTRPATDFDWTFTGGTPATAADTKGPVTVTYATGGTKTAQLVVSGAGTPPPTNGTYTIQVSATTGAVPRSVAPQTASEEEEVYDPADYTVTQVLEYAEAYPDQIDELIAAEEAGKNRSTLIAQLEAMKPFDPADYNVDEVVAYAETNPDELEEIISAEQAGKNRSTLISQLEAMRPA